ncbi:hypothetical protein [Chromobacterium amazonense]|nr:hypothetical protein [Chromobacterium amazonense]
MSLYRVCSHCQRSQHIAGGGWVTTKSGAGQVWRCAKCKTIN